MLRGRGLRGRTNRRLSIVRLWSIMISQFCRFPAIPLGTGTRSRFSPAIESLTVPAGQLSPRALGLLLEWATIHQGELMEDWRLAREQAPLNPIPPLE